MDISLELHFRYFFISFFNFKEWHRFKATHVRNDITWEPESRVQTRYITHKTRQNVLQSESDFVYKKIIGEKCTREWGFTREEEI